MHPHAATRSLLAAGVPTAELGDTVPAQAQVPNLLTDPVWSLDSFPLEIEFGGQTFTVPALPAINWLTHLMGPDAGLYNLVIDIFSELEDYLSDNVGQVTVIDLYRVVLEAIGVVSGRPWWVAIRLIRVAADNWHVIGPQLIMSGVDARTMPLSAWLDCTLFLTIQAMDPNSVTMFSLKLESKPDLGILETDGEPVDPFEAMINSEDVFFAMGE